MATDGGDAVDRMESDSRSLRRRLILRLGGPALALWLLCLTMTCMVTALMFLPFNIYITDGELQVYRKQPRAITPSAQPSPATPSSSQETPLIRTATLTVSPTATRPTTSAPAASIIRVTTASGAISPANVMQLAPALMIDQRGEALAWSPDGELLAVADRGARLFGLTGKQVRVLGEKDTRGLAFSPDGALLAAVQSEVVLYDVQTGATRLVLPRVRITTIGPSNQYLAWSRDGASLAVREGEVVKLLAAADGRLLGIIPANGPSGLDVSPDGRSLAVAGSRTAVIYDLATGKKSLDLADVINTVNEVAYSPDGGRVYGVGLFETQVYAWDAVGGGLLWSWKDDARLSGNALGVSPDGRLLITVSDEVRVRLFDAILGQSVHELLAHSERVTGAAFSPDGTALATTSWDGSTVIWRLPR